MHIQPYLFLEGRAEEAIEFYKAALGARVEMLMRWKDSPEPSMCTPTNADKVMHASIRIGDSSVMVSDGRNSGQVNLDNVALSIGTRDEAEADRLFAALAADGQVTMPQTKTFFSPRFGMVRDRLGVHWMVIVEP